MRGIERRIHMLPSPETFVIEMIGALQGQNPKYPIGIHAVYSGFNSAFKRAFPSINPVAFTTEMAAKGQIEVRLVRGGATLYRPGEAPVRKPSAAELASAKILGAA
jgi:hypothetical protein